MLHYLRQVRQKLIIQDNIQKYLLYAVGEIALVMIGILLALQVNNWNQQRIEKASELTYLQNLKSDIELQINEFALTIEAESNVGNVMNNAASFIEEGSYNTDMDSLNIMLAWVIANRTVNIFDATFEDLKSTGNIRLISNEQLKRQLLEFYQSIDRADRVLQKNENVKASVRESMINNLLTNFQVDYNDGLTSFLTKSGLPIENPIRNVELTRKFNATVLENINSDNGLLMLNNLITNRYFSSLVTNAIIEEVKLSAENLYEAIENELEGEN